MAAPGPWQEVTHSDGRVYFFNRETKQTTWEKPVELMSPEDVSCFKNTCVASTNIPDASAPFNPRIGNRPRLPMAESTITIKIPKLPRGNYHRKSRRLWLRRPHNSRRPQRYALPGMTDSQPLLPSLQNLCRPLAASYTHESAEEHV